MIKSMTGYGRGEAVLHGRRIVAEVRAVNNRYLDVAVKMPRAYLFAEDAVKTRVQAVAARGKADVFFTIDRAEAEGSVVKVNEPLAVAYRDALGRLSEVCDLPDNVSLSVIARFPDVLTVERAEEDLAAIGADLCTVLDAALLDFDAMRLREGEALRRDILARADEIERLTDLITTRMPQVAAEYRTRLENKLREVLENRQLDESRIVTEAAIFADKIAVDEETVRLRSHLRQLREMLAQGGATGRKLDFLMQEFNREANTIGSKCNDMTCTRHVLDMKAEMEKMREQIQNIE